MNENFRATMRAQNLSPFMRWVVFTFGRSVQTGHRSDRAVQVVDWRNERYRKIVSSGDSMADLGAGTLRGDRDL